MNEPRYFIPIVHVTKKRKVEWQVIKNFQGTWATKFPWVKLVIRENDKMRHVRCKILH
jgi:hypothetical protein